LVRARDEVEPVGVVELLGDVLFWFYGFVMVSE
jgi:hypothetical protein